MWSSSAASQAQVDAITIQRTYSAQKNRELPLSTPDHDIDSAKSTGRMVEKGTEVQRRVTWRMDRGMEQGVAKVPKNKGEPGMRWGEPGMRLF